MTPLARLRLAVILSGALLATAGAAYAWKRVRRRGLVAAGWIVVVAALDQAVSRMDFPVGDDRFPEIRLRPVDDADVELFFEHQRDPEANRVASFPPREREAFFAHWAKIRKDPAVTIRSIERYGKVVGNIGAFTRGDLREVCYWLGRAYWGKGIASEALTLFLEQAPQRPLYARIAKANAGSLRVAGKNGFKIVGEDAEEYLLRLDAKA